MKSQPSKINLPRIQRLSFIVGGIALIVAAIGGVFNAQQFFRAYLFAFIFWIGVPLGCLALLMTYHLVGGAWGVVVRRFVESAAWTLPLFVLLVIPLLCGTSFLYPWSNSALLHEGVKISSSKLAYFKSVWFVLRTVLYFVTWGVIMRTMRKWADKHSEDVEAASSDRLRVASGWGLVLYCLLASFASFDWVMSLEPNWYSTIYGMLFVVGQGLNALTTLILLLSFLGEREQLARLTEKPLLDLGNLLLTFVMLWTYLAFMQFLIIWAGNLKAEIPWYVRRSHDGWQFISWALFLFHFLLPFALLLSRANKRRIQILTIIAGCLWLSRFVDYFWHFGPLPNRPGIPLHWLYFVTPVALGGIWFGVFLRQLNQRRPLVLIPNEEAVVA